jgi:hypothetical protein
MSNTPATPEYSMDKGTFYVPQNLDEQLRLLANQQDYRGKAHRDVISGRLAIILVIVMGLGFCAYCIGLSLVPAEPTVRLEALRSAFNGWLPAVTGFVGAAIAYYFAKDK